MARKPLDTPESLTEYCLDRNQKKLETNKIFEIIKMQLLVLQWSRDAKQPIYVDKLQNTTH